MRNLEKNNICQTIYNTLSNSKKKWLKKRLQIAKHDFVLFNFLSTNYNTFQDIVLSSTLEVESFKIKRQPLVKALFRSVTVFITQQLRINVTVTSI